MKKLLLITSLLSVGGAFGMQEQEANMALAIVNHTAGQLELAQGHSDALQSAQNSRDSRIAYLRFGALAAMAVGAHYYDVKTSNIQMYFLSLANVGVRAGLPTAGAYFIGKDIINKSYDISKKIADEQFKDVATKK